MWPCQPTCGLARYLRVAGRFTWKLRVPRANVPSSTRRKLHGWLWPGLRSYLFCCILFVKAVISLLRFRDIDIDTTSQWKEWENFQSCFKITAVLALTTNYLHSSRVQNTLSPLVRPPQSFIPLLHHPQAQGAECYLLNQGHMQMRLFKFSALAIASLDLKTC